MRFQRLKRAIDVEELKEHLEEDAKDFSDLKKLNIEEQQILDELIKEDEEVELVEAGCDDNCDHTKEQLLMNKSTHLYPNFEGTGANFNNEV